ncbi:MAG TPA: TIGR01777 family oxidoreductase [Candidatus Cybelea sp.]|nr:TIGR01777 family oxidoreductase [Candidatus Cybelea sp.]
MRILISGASGLIGTAASSALRADGHTVAHIVRPGGNFLSGDVRWDPVAGAIELRAMEGADVIIHLSGASIGQGHWTQERKSILRASRIESTRLLVNAIEKLGHKPRVLLSASAIGYYGNRGDEVLTESSTNGSDFLAKLTSDWEAESRRADSLGVRTALLRFGVILSTRGGALPRMLLPFRLGLGGRLGSGKQWMSWVALADVVETVRAAVADERFSGPINIVAPNPVQNSKFTRVLARALRRPALFPAPAFMLRLALGEMADELLLTSQRVEPGKLKETGFPFQFPELQSALTAVFRELQMDREKH